jgi:type I restriction enzyme S subunit
MSRQFRVKAVPSTWLESNGRRLDCGPYVSGAIEARELLRRFTTSPLKGATAGHEGGIYNGPQFARNYVEDSRFGVPFLTTSSLLQADLSLVSYLSRRDAESSKLSYLRIIEGMTLITCSGTIGRMTYARKDMEGMWSNQDIIKVVPNRDSISPGYLFAFLSSRYGLPLVLNGTYGAIIQHIEPSHIADLPVPRLGPVEIVAHDLIQRAADLRTDAARLLCEATANLVDELQFPKLQAWDVTKFGCSAVSSQDLKFRLDAPYHSPAALEAEQAIRSGRHGYRRLAEVTERLFKPPIFKRIWVDDHTYGRQFVSGTDAYLYEANDLRFVSTRTPNFEEFVVKRGWVIFQAAGQIYGLFGRPLFVSGWLEDIFCADDLYRIVPKCEVDGAYIFLFLRSPHGQVLVKRQASGNSIPRVWDPHMEQFELPWPDKPIRKRLARPVLDAHEKLADALKLQRQAIEVVEKAIEEGGR